MCAGDVLFIYCGPCKRVDRTLRSERRYGFPKAALYTYALRSLSASVIRRRQKNAHRTAVAPPRSEAFLVRDAENRESVRDPVPADRFSLPLRRASLFRPPDRTPHAKRHGAKGFGRGASSLGGARCGIASWRACVRVRLPPQTRAVRAGSAPRAPYSSSLPSLSEIA